MTVRTDNFHRADASTLGANWTAWSWSGATSPHIATNAVVAIAASTHGAYWSADAFGNDQFSEIQIGTVSGSSDWIGMTVRQVSPGTGYLAIYFNGQFMLFNENGTTSPTLLASAAGTVVPGDVLRLTVTGTNLVLIKNGAQVLTFSSSTWTTGTPGIALYGTSGSIVAWDGGDVGPNVTVDTTTLANCAQNVKVRRWLQASGGTGPYTWSVTVGTLPTGLSLSSSGELTGTPTGTGASTFTVQATDSGSISGTASVTLTIVAAAFTPGSPTTDGNGVVTRSITSVLNGNTSESLRVLVPTSPSPSYRRAGVIVSPVNSGTDDTTFGNALDTIRILGLHNSLNLTVLEPSNGGNWLADNPLNANRVQETWMRQVAAWFKANYLTGGFEKLFLCGFSRSGLASLGLYLHSTDLYDGCAVWDFPGMMDGYAGSDPNGTVGGSPDSSYGTPENFTANYQLSAANLAKWKAGTDLGAVKRIHIGGANFFNADVPQIDGVLTTAGILHFYKFVTTDSHNWHPSPDWLPTALANLQTLSSKSTGLLSATWPA
jgi:Putative Ig domain